MSEEVPSGHSAASPVLFLLILSVVVMIGALLSRGSQPRARSDAELTPVRFDVSEEVARREEAIRRALDRDVTVEYDNVPLEKALADLSRRLDVSIYIDRATLQDEGVALDSEVTFPQATLTGRSALRKICEPFQLSWYTNDELLVVTTSVRTGEMMQRLIYDVADVVAVRDTTGLRRNDFRNLIDALTGTIEPESWEEVGGPGTIREVDSGGIAVLSISQTQRNHDQIAEFLSQLRKKARPDRLTVRSNESLHSSRTERPLPVPSTFHGPRGMADPMIAALVRGNNELALSLYTRLAHDSRGNVLISPIGLSTALATLAHLADGTTAGEIMTVAEFVLPDDTLETGYSSFREFLTDPTVIEPGSTAPLGRSELQIVSGLWTAKNLSISESMAGNLKDFFGVVTSKVDFANPNETARLINTWSRDRTDGMIPQVVSSRDFSEMTAFLIASAVTFRGKWMNQFDVQETRPGEFSTGSSKVDVRLMHDEKDPCRYASIDGLQVLEKPYQSGNRSLVILLPEDASTDLSQLESKLSERTLLRWLAAASNLDVDLFLPRFRMEFGTEFSQEFKARGMRKAFDPSQAEFPLISHSQPVAVERIFQRTSIDVDEEGTRAAAVTAIHGTFGGGPRRQMFRADHPFVFLIRDVRTGCILFIGRLVDPTATAAEVTERG